MRPIKFRAWDPIKKEWLCKTYLEYLCIGNDVGVIIKYGPNKTGGYDPVEIKQLSNPMRNRIELMQFTGLLDKNGKEIWEGDVNMDDDNRRSEIVFSAGGFYFKYSRTEYKSIGSFAPFNYMVIGNIYENPELMEGK